MNDFDWDEDNIRHIARHDVTVEEAEYVLEHQTVELGRQHFRGEERFAEVGMTAQGRIVLVVITWRDERIRVVTAYDASKAQRVLYSRME